MAINRERKHKYQFTQDEAPRLFSLLALEEKEVFTFQLVACPSNHQEGSPLYLETKTLTWLPDRLEESSYLGTRSTPVFPVTWKGEPAGKWLEKVTEEG